MLMKEYTIVAVMWEDHYHATQSLIPRNPDTVVERPTLTVGILMSETEKTLLIAHDIERYEDRDESSYTVILKATIVGGPKKYGTIELDGIRYN
jgi:hypothetical protein